VNKTLWVKLSVDYYNDPKIVTAGPLAELLFVRGLAYAKKTNDPTIPRVMVPRLAIGIEADPTTLASCLVNEGLWTEGDGGFTITAWETWQVNATNQGQSAGGTLAMHNRWHKHTRSSTCPHCQDTASDERVAQTDNTPKPKPEKAWPVEAINLCHRLAGWIEKNGGRAIRVTDEWCNEMEKLHRIDGYGWDEIGSVIDWCQRDSFWKTNILSPAKLRKQFTQLRMKMAAPVRSGVNPEAEQAWMDVQQQVRTVGYTGVPSFAAPKTHAVVRQIGWGNICRSQPEAMKQQFIRTYNSHTDSD
jgi:hypothetical protein